MRDSSFRFPLGLIEWCHFVCLLWRHLLNTVRLLNLLTLATMTLVKLGFCCSFRWIIKISNRAFWLSWTWSTNIVSTNWHVWATCTVSTHARLFGTFMIKLWLRWAWWSSTLLGKLLRCQFLAIWAESSILASIGTWIIEIYLNIRISVFARFLHGLFLLPRWQRFKIDWRRFAFIGIIQLWTLLILLWRLLSTFFVSFLLWCLIIMHFAVSIVKNPGSFRKIDQINVFSNEFRNNRTHIVNLWKSL